MKECVFVPGPPVERSRYDRGRLRIEWRPGWHWLNTETGRLQYPPMTRKDAREFAKDMGQKAVFKTVSTL